MLRIGALGSAVGLLATCVALHCQVGCVGRGETPADATRVEPVAPVRSDMGAPTSAARGAFEVVVLVVEGFQKARSGAT